VLAGGILVYADDLVRTVDSQRKGSGGGRGMVNGGAETVDVKEAVGAGASS
jgi:hypothetical protein